MKSRTQIAWRNISSGLVYKILMLLMSFAIRTVFIWTLGLEYLGLNSLFTSILGILNLAELGFSGALVASMYKPFAEHDLKKVNALLKIYKQAYHIIGSVILIVGLLITPILPKLISGSYPEEINLYVVYWLNLAGVVVTYFLFAYKICILTVAQRNDIVNIVHIILMMAQYGAQFLVLFIYKNYYFYIIILPITNAVINLILAYISVKKYPEFVCEGKITEIEKQDIKKKIAGLTLGKVSNALCNGLDSIIISSFLGLVILGKYNLYYYVFSALNAVLYVIISSIISTIGNSMATCSRKKNLYDFNRLNFFWGWLISWCTACLVCLYQPFIQLWQGKKSLFSISTMFVFCLYFYVQHNGMVIQLYKDAAGLWWEDRWRMAVEGIVNIIFNIILVNFLGVTGVLLSSIFTIVVISQPWQSLVLYKWYFKTRNSKFYLEQIKRFLATFIVSVISYLCIQMIPIFVYNKVPFFSFILKGIIVSIISNILLLLIWRKNRYFKEGYSKVKWILKRQFKRIK